MDIVDINGIDFTSFISTWNGGSGNYLMIANNSNSSNEFIIMTISSITNNTTYFTIAGSASGNLFITSPENISVIYLQASNIINGSSTIDFGNTPGTNIVVITITGQTQIKTTSKVKAYLVGQASTTHNAYEHLIVPINITCGNIVAGSQFDIYASSPVRLDGAFNICWEYII